MTEVDLLRAAVLRDPADDTVRAAYSDALREADPPDPELAEFVTVQLEAWRRWSARGVEPELTHYQGTFEKVHGRPITYEEAFHTTCGCDWCVLRRRERELLRAHAERWSAAPDFSRVRFRRGFVDRVTCSTRTAFDEELDAFLARLNLFGRHPVTEVDLVDFGYGGYPGSDVVRVYVNDTFRLVWTHGITYLPVGLRRFITGGRALSAYGDNLFPSRDAAAAALSRAVVDLARHRARLPPLNR